MDSRDPCPELYGLQNNLGGFSSVVAVMEYREREVVGCMVCETILLVPAFVRAVPSPLLCCLTIPNPGSRPGALARLCRAAVTSQQLIEVLCQNTPLCQPCVSSGCSLSDLHTKFLLSQLAMASGSTAYSERARDVVVYGSVALALAMAQETGVVRVLCDPDTCQPLTAQQVADKARLKERYVRELLGSLATSGLVQLAPGTGGREGPEAGYVVPQECREDLMKTAMTSLLLSVVAHQYPAVKTCIPAEGPYCVRYSPQLFHILEQFSGEDGKFVDAILKELPDLSQKLESGAQVAEFGCGSGLLMQKMAARFPASTFLLTDFAQQSLTRVQELAREASLQNVTTQTADVCALTPDWYDRFDFVLTKDVIHDLPYPQRALDGIAQSLRAGGVYVMIDQTLKDSLVENVDDKNAIFNYSVATFLCVPEGYQQPDATVIGPTWGQLRARCMLEKAGLHVLAVVKVPEFDSMAIYLCRKEGSRDV